MGVTLLLLTYLAAALELDWLQPRSQLTQLAGALSNPEAKPDDSWPKAWATDNIRSMAVPRPTMALDIELGELQRAVQQLQNKSVGAAKRIVGPIFKMLVRAAA